MVNKYYSDLYKLTKTHISKPKKYDNVWNCWTVKDNFCDKINKLDNETFDFPPNTQIANYTIWYEKRSKVTTKVSDNVISIDFVAAGSGAPVSDESTLPATEITTIKRTWFGWITRIVKRLKLRIAHMYHMEEVPWCAVCVNHARRKPNRL